MTEQRLQKKVSEYREKNAFLISYPRMRDSVHRGLSNRLQVPVFSYP